MEREIVDVQEEQLKNLDGLEEMTSESADGLAYIDLMFEIGTDTDEALLRVSNKLDQVKQYPDGVDKPVIKSGGRSETAIAWMILQALDGYDGVLSTNSIFWTNMSSPAWNGSPGWPRPTSTAARSGNFRSSWTRTPWPRAR